MPRLDLEISTVVKRGYPKPRVYPPMDGQNVRNSLRKARILMPRLELEISTVVKRGHPKPRVYPPMDGQNVRNSLGKAKILEPMLGWENFKLCQTEPSKA